MDAKDVRIFCEIAFKNPGLNSIIDRRISPSEIGRKVGLDEKTVRVRIKKMEEEGFIKYYQALPCLPLIGIDMSSWFRFGSLNLATKRSLVEYMQQTSNILETYDYLGTFVSASIAGVSAMEVQQVADALVSRFELAVLARGDHPSARTRIHPDNLDWQIMKELRYNGRAAVKDVAGALSITPRMAEYRIKRLLEGEAVQVRAVIDAKKQHGIVFFEVELTVEEGSQFSVASTLTQLYAEELWSVQTLRGGVVLASFFGFSLGETEETTNRCSGLECVRSSTLYVLKEMVEPREPNWLDNLIDHRISAALMRSGGPAI